MRAVDDTGLIEAINAVYPGCARTEGDCLWIEGLLYETVEYLISFSLFESRNGLNTKMADVILDYYGDEIITAVALKGLP